MINFNLLENWIMSSKVENCSINIIIRKSKKKFNQAICRYYRTKKKPPSKTSIVYNTQYAQYYSHIKSYPISYYNLFNARCIKSSLLNVQK